MSFDYTRTQLKARVNAKIHGKIGMITDVDELMNDAVREVLKTDLRSAKRRAQLQPNLFTNVFTYAAPTDLKGMAVIDIRPQVLNDNEEKIKFGQTMNNEFSLRKMNGRFSVEDYNGIQQLKISAQIDDKSLAISTLDSLIAGGGTWEAFGDAENLEADKDNFVVGNGSVKWGISSAGGTTAGIKNTDLNSFDLDDEYLGGNGACFVWVYINTTDNITNFKLRLGSSESAYHEKTVTAASDNTAFVQGWNLLRFDLTNLTTTAPAPDDDAITYAAIYMTKDSAKVSETDYRFDHLILRKGKIYNVHYYTKYGWQNNAGAYLENSTADTDVLVADTDEINMIFWKATELAAEEVNEYDIADKYAKKFEDGMKDYVLVNPSEAMVITTKYYDFVQTDGCDDRFGNDCNSNDNFFNAN